MAAKKKKKARKGVKRGRGRKGAVRSSTAKRGGKRMTLKKGLVVARKPSKAQLKTAKAKATKVGKLATSAKKGATVYKVTGKKRRAGKRGKRK